MKKEENGEDIEMNGAEDEENGEEEFKLTNGEGEDVEEEDDEESSSKKRKRSSGKVCLPFYPTWDSSALTKLA